MKKCKVKSIPVTEVTEGMQVLDIIFGGICIITNTKPELTSSAWVKPVEIKFVTKPVEIKFVINSKLGNREVDELKTIVVEYEYEYDDDSRQRVYDTKQLPLKDSDWQQAINNGLLDTDKEGEIEIVDQFGGTHDDLKPQVAKFNREIVYTVPKYIIENALDALRMAANTLKSRKRETAMDRQIEFSERLLKWVVNGGQGKVPNWIPSNDEKEN
jgi:hypothetical protein